MLCVLWDSLADNARKINVRRFKEFVGKNFAPETPLCRVLMSERDGLSPEDLAARFEVWLKLVNLSLPQESKRVLES